MGGAASQAGAASGRRCGPRAEGPVVSRRLGALIAALALVLPALGTATPAQAQDVDTAANALRDAPLYVDDAVRSSLDATERRTILRKLRGRRPPVLVVVIPLVPGDAVDGEPRKLLEVLRRRLDTDATLVAADNSSLTVEPADVEDARTYAASTVASLEGEYREPVAITIERFLDALDDPDVLARAQRARDKLSSEAEDSGTTPARGDETGDGGGTVPFVLLGVALVVLAGGVGALLLARRRATPAPDGAPVLPAHVFAAARNARHAQLRRTLDDELVAFAGLLDRTPTPESGAAAEHWQRALEIRDVAAAIAGDPDARDVDLVGALVLEDAARAQLGAATALDAGRAEPTPAPAPCGLNPTHGRSTTQARWGGAPRMPVCSACAKDVAAGRRPDVLEDRGRAYLEQETPWAATAFGTLPGDLVGAVRADRATRR
ncbi:hypothetical protein C7Y72_02975 [Paraconexibacter algicola]|uniref:Uncharacterized protein n=1 Tax=Paraconexibacter algicola TaxID=2133960 RepID=A0A2T4UHG0_9ACTN|nr:hypothetical protein C7Y72_02975 [Paraconexibacter algicola]